MTPDQIVTAFAQRGPLPKEALVAAGAEQAAMVPVFLELIDRLIAAKTLDAAAKSDIDAFLFAFFLLGEWRTTEAYRPLAQLLQGNSEMLDAMLGDGITEITHRVMVGVFDGDLQPLFDIVVNPDADDFVRTKMMDALCWIAINSPEYCEAASDFFRTAGDWPQHSEITWESWTFAVAALGLSDLIPQVQAVFERGTISPHISTYSDFEQEYNRTISEGPGWYKRLHQHDPIKDAVRELEGWHCFSDAYLSGDVQRPGGGLEDFLENLVSLPYRSETRSIGRNDPCPCGSGRKFKKCCLQ